MSPVNYYAILVCGIASLMLGMFWYGPLFGGVWMKQVGFTEKDMLEARKKGMKCMLPNMIIATISSMVMAFVLTNYLSYSGAVDMTKALIVGAFVWFGFYATSSISPVLWEKKTWTWYFITIGYQLVQILMFCAILISLK
ncbi:MAG: DUF1761 domain-containing protein [Candidatus Peregrinibacteria bacterium]|nr:DUF1761 domain-containing protein [Candidatus Peregrinibacteria bacterium]